MAVHVKPHISFFCRAHGFTTLYVLYKEDLNIALTEVRNVGYAAYTELKRLSLGLHESRVLTNSNPR